MRILAIETTGPFASVALIDEKGDISEKKNGGGMNHLTELIPMTEALLAEEGLSMADVSAVAASRGPGSFTGIRIGVSTARALAQAAGIPCVPVPTLETFIYNSDEPDGAVICPLFDARRSQVYAGAFAADGNAVVPGGAYMLEEYAELLRGVSVSNDDIVFFGDGADRFGEELAAAFPGSRTAPEEERYQTAASVARLALGIYEAGRVTRYDEFVPDYMRKAEAERKLEKGLLNVGNKR